MMTLPELFLLAVALALDCFSVALASALAVRRWQWRPVLLMALLFGLFQALMPVLGWALTARFQDYIAAVGHWLAFGLLVWLGVNMIIESRRPEEARHLDFTRLTTILVAAVATSVDALAVGVSFACIGMRSAADLWVPVAVIGSVSFVLTLVAFALGVYGGRHVSPRLHPELLGGLILIGIAVRILAEHLAA